MAVGRVTVESQFRNDARVFATSLPTRFFIPCDDIYVVRGARKLSRKKLSPFSLSSFTTRLTPYISPYISSSRTIANAPGWLYVLRARDNDIFAVSAKHSSGTTNTPPVITRNHNHCRHTEREREREREREKEREREPH